MLRASVATSPPLLILVLVLVLVFVLVGSFPAHATLSEEEIRIRQSIDARRDSLLATLDQWVDQNTGTFNIEGLRAFAQSLLKPLEELGFTVLSERGTEVDIPGRGRFETGPLVTAHRPAREGQREPAHFLLVGHYDTVFEPDSPFQQFRLSANSPGRATGPGIVDMKGGIVVMLAALRALEQSGDLGAAEWTVIFNADEEIGSLGSRARIEEAARRATAGFVFEAAYEGGVMVRSRRGLGQFYLTVDGVAAHAGSAHEKGRSAIREIVEKVRLIEALTDYQRGINLNVGTLQGGTKRNIVPFHAEAWIDLRYDTPEMGQEMRVEIEEISERNFVEGTSTALWGTLHRPPKIETKAVRELLGKHSGVAEDMGVGPAEPVHAGGGTDGSLMGAVGLPTLDSMGAEGGEAHTDREFIEVDSLTRRAAIAAILMRRLALERKAPQP